MSGAEATLMMAFLLPMLLALSWVREELRSVEPLTRFGFGIAAFLGAFAVFFAVMKLLPAHDEIDGSLPLQSLLMGAMSLFASGLVLSISLMFSAGWQALKRWNYFRRKVD